MTLLCPIIIIAILIGLFYCKKNRSKVRGLWGEKKVSALLALLGGEYKVLNDVLIRTPNGDTTQIDHIVVSPYGIFVIETKNYKGWILGGENSDKWTQNIWGNKYQMPNPIHQNEAHIRSLKKTIPNISENKYISIVVFTHNASLKVHASDEKNVITTKLLLNRIKSYQNTILSEQNQSNFIKTIESVRLTSGKEKEAHVNMVKTKTSRRESLINAGICPKCKGTLVLKTGKYGSFYGCSNYPKCDFITHSQSKHY